MNQNFTSPLNLADGGIKNKTITLPKESFNIVLNTILTAPRGFCAGVRRAVEIVERAIEKYGVPIYVKHEIVHNKFVVEYFKNKGVIFIDDETQVPNRATVIYSAHGVSDSVEQNCKNKSIKTIDATCPLVKKVHREVVEYDTQGIEIILIGHKHHPEMLGTSGRIASKNFTIIENLDDAKNFVPKDPQKLAIATQTTLSMMETSHITEYLTKKFPSIVEGQRLKNDICYATENRQKAVKNALQNHKADILVVIGASNSSNSNRLADIGEEFGVKSFLTEKFTDEIIVYIKKILTNQSSKENTKNELNVIVTAGASAPEVLVNDFIETLSSYFTKSNCIISEIVKEDTYFILPREVR